MRATSVRFSDILLQEDVARHLSGSLGRGRIRQTYLLCGKRSVGKNMLAGAFAAALQCLQPEMAVPGFPEACGRCLSCKRIANGNHPDVSTISPLGQDIKIDQVRKLQELAVLHPFMGKWRIFLIDPADRLNEYSSNCLLKILEEAPERVVFLLLAENPEGVLPTISSRSEILRCCTPSHQAARDHLSRAFGLSSEAAMQSYSLSEGYFGRALRLAREGGFPPMPLPLVQSHQDYLQAIVGLGLHIQSLIPESESLEEALRKLEEPDSFFHIPLLVSRKCCARGLLMSAGLPQSFPLMFSDLMISSTKSLQAILKGHVEGLVKQQKQAYEGSLVKDLEKQLLAAIGKIGLAEIQEFLDSLLNWFHDSLAFGVSGNETLLLNADRKEDIMTITGVRGLARIRNMIETVVRGMELLRRNVQPTLVLESVLMNIGGSNP